MTPRDRDDRRGPAPRPGRNTIRAFVAIHLPAAVRELLVATAREIRGTTLGVKWVEPQNLHMTVAFLGDIEPASVEGIAAALAGAAADEAPITARIEGLGAFPNLRRPRVIWAGIGAGAPELVRVAGKAAAALREAGVYFDDKPFSPHVTLGRVREGVVVPGEVLRRIEAARPATDPFTVEALHLMKSQLTPGGPIYHSLRVIRLGAA